MKLFQKPSAEQLAQQEYEDAERALLEHLSAKEYHTKMSEYYGGKVTRLKAYLQRVE